jgi:hypothetical protein
MLELPQRLGLDLPDAPRRSSRRAKGSPRHRELLADFFERVAGVQADAEADTQPVLLARRQ